MTALEELRFRIRDGLAPRRSASLPFYRPSEARRVFCMVRRGCAKLVHSLINLFQL